MFPVIRGDSDTPSGIINELSQKVAGYFAIQTYPSNLFSAAPKYEAFVALEEGLKHFGEDYRQAEAYFQQAIALDSNFIGVCA